MFNLTANDMTTISLIFGVISVVALYQQNAILFVSSYILSYFFDCVDGAYARHYNMVTQFGDWYDHVKDVIINVLIGILSVRLAWIRGGGVCRYSLLILLLGMMVVTMRHLSLMEIYHERDESVSEDQRANKALRMIREENQHRITDRELHDQLSQYRFVGTGTFILCVALVGVVLMKT
jgi:phosphatidylglycerophosphate synthase